MIKRLRSHEAYWHSDEAHIKEMLKRDPETLTKEELIEVLGEVDRRFMQLWVKVTFERKHCLRGRLK